jgi:ABC-type bacteriocin/lantibiotic exporter with double-glycine peptidase domain
MRSRSGSIRIAACDPSLLDESERRRVLGVVPQVLQLFSGTVMENLTMRDTSVPDDCDVRGGSHRWTSPSAANRFFQ